MLRAAGQADLGFIVDLQARPENLRWIAADPPAHLARDLLDPETRVLIWDGDDTARGFAILDTRPDRPGRVELRRLAVAEPGRGTGTAMMAALCDHVFADPQAHRFFLDVAADNVAARRLYDALGFVHEGTLRRHWLRRSGDWADLAYYGLLREDWQAGRPGDRNRHS